VSEVPDVSITRRKKIFLKCKFEHNVFEFIGNSGFQTLITLPYSGRQVTRERLLCLDPELELHSNQVLTKTKIIILSHVNVVNFIGPVKIWSSVCCTLHHLSYRQGLYIQGVTGGTDQTSGGCSLC